MTFRLFLAVLLPKAMRAGLEAVVDPLRAGGGVRWVRGESLHITLTFLGERPAGQVEAIAACAGPACAAIAPFSLQVVGLGCFPSPARPRVLWAGLGSGRPSLLGLQRAVLESLVRAELAQDEGRFDPHVTLGRVQDWLGASQRAELGRRFAALRLPALPPSPVEAAFLMRSHLGRTGPAYAVLREFPLRGSP